MILLVKDGTFVEIVGATMLLPDLVKERVEELSMRGYRLATAHEQEEYMKVKRQATALYEREDT